MPFPEFLARYQPPQAFAQSRQSLSISTFWPSTAATSRDFARQDQHRRIRVHHVVDLDAHGLTIAG